VHRFFKTRSDFFGVCTDFLKHVQVFLVCAQIFLKHVQIFLECAQLFLEVVSKNDGFRKMSKNDVFAGFGFFGSGACFLKNGHRTPKIDVGVLGFFAKLVKKHLNWRPKNDVFFEKPLFTKSSTDRHISMKKKEESEGLFNRYTSSKKMTSDHDFRFFWVF